MLINVVGNEEGKDRVKPDGKSYWENCKNIISINLEIFIFLSTIVINSFKCDGFSRNQIVCLQRGLKIFPLFVR